MSKYVIKVFEKQDNGELIPHAYNEENTSYGIECGGYFIMGITTEDLESGKTQFSTETALHDITVGELGSALYSCEQARDALMSFSKRRLLEKLLSGELEPKEKSDDAAE